MAGNKQFVNLLSTLFPLMPKGHYPATTALGEATDEVPATLCLPLPEGVEANARGITFRESTRWTRRVPTL